VEHNSVKKIKMQAIVVCVTTDIGGRQGRRLEGIGAPAGIAQRNRQRAAALRKRR
jgi:hypothetical protein